MPQPQKQKKYPITIDEHDYVRHVTDYVIREHFVYDDEKSADYNALNKRDQYRVFSSDLKYILHYPDTVSAWFIGAVFRKLHSADRMMVLKMRPTLIQNSNDIAILLRLYIPANDKLLFACSVIEHLIVADAEASLNNIARIAQLLPKNERHQFFKFAEKMIIHTFAPDTTDVHPAEQQATTSKRRKPMPQHAASFSAAFLLSAVGILSHYYRSDPVTKATAFLSAAACAAHGFYDLHQEGRLNRVLLPITRRLHTLWAPAQTKPVSNELPLTPKPAFG